MGTTIHPDSERLRIYDEQVRRMVADPDMRGDVLAVGLALAWVYRENGPGETMLSTVAEIAKLDDANHRRANVTALEMLSAAVRDDAPRYEMDWRAASRCEAPMIRREGLCGKHPTCLAFTSVNWDDGTRNRHAFCRRHEADGHRIHREILERDRQRKAEQGDPPSPAANRGGLLARHFPAIDWDPLYSWARPGWKPPGEVPASYTEAAPMLRLLSGDGEAEKVVGGRPDLSVVHGMPDRLSGRQRHRKPGPRPL